MEQNLTRYLNVVTSSSAGLNPKPGYDLVVLKEAKSGYQFDRVIPDGQPVEQGKMLSRLFNKDHQYLCYAVNRDPHIRHRFDSNIEHMSHGHEFELGYVLSFAVANPRIIVERLTDDPVRKLEEHVRYIVDAEARKIPWKELEEAVLESAGGELTQKILDQQIEGVRGFAATYGIGLQSIGLTWHLADEEVETRRARLKTDRQKELARLEHELAKEKAWQEDEITTIDVRTAMKKQLPKHVDRAPRTLSKAFIMLRNWSTPFRH